MYSVILLAISVSFKVKETTGLVRDLGLRPVMCSGIFY